MIAVEYSNRGREYWAGRPYAGKEWAERRAAAAVLLVPQEGFRDYAGPVYPVGTEELFQLLREALPGQDVDLIVEDHDYRELALHHDWLTIVHLVAEAALLPVVLEVLSEYIKRRLWKPKPEDTVKIEITVVNDAAGDRVTRINYEGPPEHMRSSIEAAVAQTRQTEDAPSVRTRVADGIVESADESISADRDQKRDADAGRTA